MCKDEKSIKDLKASHKDLESRLDEIEASYLSRKDDPPNVSNGKVTLIFWIATLALTALTAGFVGLTIFAGVTLKAERQSLKDWEGKVESTLEKQIEKIDIALGSVIRKPNVVALTLSGVPLEGKTIKGKRIMYGQVTFSFILKNEGSADSDQLYLKVYTKKPFKMVKRPDPSTDEKEYDYESHQDPADPDYMKGKMVLLLPAKASRVIHLRSSTPIPDDVLKTKHQVLIKIYYGGENPYRCEFTIHIIEWS